MCSLPENRSHVAEKNCSIFGDSGQTKRMGLMGEHNYTEITGVFILYEKKLVSYTQLTTQQSPLVYASKPEEYKDI